MKIGTNRGLDLGAGKAGSPSGLESALQTRLALNSLIGDLLVSAFPSAELKGMSRSLAMEF